MPRSYQHDMPEERVHITYDLDPKSDKKKELPFVLGVLGDFSGNPTEPLKKLGDRKFVNIDRYNFDEVLDRMKPGLQFRVDNTLSGEGELAVDLKFEKMEDFEPAKVAGQIKPLKELLDLRQKINDILAMSGRATEVEEKLEEILKDRDAVERLAKELGIEAAAEAASDDGGGADSGGDDSEKENE